MDSALGAAAASAQVTFEDGLGTRQTVVDRVRNEALEMLCLRGELTLVPSFEAVLRERVSDLEGFRHGCYAQVRRVERLNDASSTLALVSDATDGVRLSEILKFAERPDVTLDIDAALCLLRQLVPAVAMLHEEAPDIAHGAIAAERLVVTPNARIVVVEHVLGSALEQLRFSHERYWKELRIALPKATGVPRFGHRADVTQLGVVALSLILGRRLLDDEGPSRLGDLVGSAWAVSARGGLEPLPAGLRAWLKCALQLDAKHSFGSAIDAQEELERVLGESDYLAAPATLESFLAEYRATVPVAVVVPVLAVTPVAPVAPASRIVPAAKCAPVAHSTYLAPSAPDVAAAPAKWAAALAHITPPARVGHDAPAAQAGRTAPAAPVVLAAPVPLPAPVVLAAPVVLHASVVLPPPVASVAPIAHAAQAERTEPAELFAHFTPKASAPASPAAPVERAAPATLFAPVALPVAPVAHAPLFAPVAPVASVPHVPLFAPATPVAHGGHGAPLPSATLFAPAAPVPAAAPAAMNWPPPPQVPAPPALRKDPVTWPSPLDVAPIALEESDEEQPRKRWQLVAAAVVLIALAGAGVTAARRYAAPTASNDGTLIVTTNPPGARLLVDGVEKGATPMTVTLKAGAHELELHSSGAVRQVPITMTAGAQMSQYIDLPTTASAFGQLQVRTEPAGARVSVDGVARGISPVTVSDLPPGEHTLLLDSSLGAFKQSVTIEAGVIASLTVPLSAPEIAPVSGWIAVSAPSEVQVFEGTRLLGTSQSDRLMVSAGRHEIHIVNETLGYRATRTVQVSPGKISPVRIEFPKGTIAINAIPWAEVWVDGEKIGDTPIGNLQLTVGPHEFVFRHPDLGEQHHAATITLMTPARLSVDLRKK